MSYFANLRARIRKATTSRQAQALAEKLVKADIELRDLQSQLAECQQRCRCDEKAKKAPKFVVFDKYTNQRYGMAKTRGQGLKMAASFPDSARIMPTKQWLSEGNSID